MTHSELADQPADLVDRLLTVNDAWQGWLAEVRRQAAEAAKAS